MPDYSRVSIERDIYAEMAWIPNFQITYSKNNKDRHLTYKELFDRPKDYTGEFCTGQLTNSDYFKSQAPPGSIAATSIPIGFIRP